MSSSFRQNQAKWIALALLLAFLVSLVPLFAISAYDRPALDDYVHGQRTHEVWLSTHSVLSVLSEAVRVTVDTWKNWQGSFTDIFLSALQPGLFAESFYWIDPVITFLLFLMANLVFFYGFLHRLLGLDRWNTLSVALIQMTIALQLLPSPAQGFYWHCSTCAYIWMYSLTQILAVLLLKSYLNPKKRYAVITPIVAFFTAGCNFSTVLLVLVLFILYLLLLMVKKRREPVAFIAFFAFVAGFLLSVLAPGNAVRMAGYGVDIGPAEAIIQSLFDSLHLMAEWTTVPFLLLEVLTLPFLYPVIQKCSFRFRYPLLMPLFTYLLVGVGLTPLIYGYGEISQWATRVFNLLFFLYAILFNLCLCYFVGWARRVFLNRAEHAAIDPNHPAGVFTPYIPWALGFFAAILLVFGYSSMQEESFYAFKLSHMSSVSAFFSLKNGEAQAFAKEMDARLPALTDASVTNPRFPPLKHKPYVLLIQDIDSNPGGWVNEMWAGYYRKDSVALTN